MFGRLSSDYSSQLSSTEEHGSIEKTLTSEEEETVKKSSSGPPQPLTEIFKAHERGRTETPNTYLSEVADKPDITIFCELCRTYINIRLLKHHRAYHDALQLLGCKNHVLPKTTEILLEKRGSVLKKMSGNATKDNPLQPKQVERVNNAYELLKSELEDTFDIFRKLKDTVDTSCRALSLSSSVDCVSAIGICSSPNSQWKSEMEDTKVYQDCFGENKDKCYFGLFDGYHGRFTAEVAVSFLHKMLLHTMAKFDGSLSIADEEVFDEEIDISHHRFVFGANAKLDFDSCDAKESKDKAAGRVEKDPPFLGERPVTIHVDDAELTRRIIELCENKYENVLKAASSPDPPEKAHNIRGGNTGRTKHPQEFEIGQAFCKSYQLLDILLSYGKDEWSRVRWSGCSALTVLVESVVPSIDSNLEAEFFPNETGDGQPKVTIGSSQPKVTKPIKVKGYIHLANAGDTRAVLVRGNRAYRLSKDHTPHNPKECNRIIKMGGKLSTSEVDSRVNGVLSTTRGLGNHGDVGLKACVVVEPHTSSIQIDEFAQFLVLSTRGVWEVFSDQEVANLLLRFMIQQQKQLPVNQIPPPSKPSSSLKGLLGVKVGTCAEESGSQTADDGKDGGDHGSKEKGTYDAAISEEDDDPQHILEPLSVAADLMTEVGSHMGEGDDHEQDLENDTVTLPVHSNLQLGDPQSVQQKRRELARQMAEHLVQAALLAGSRNNVTVVVVLLPGCGM